MRPLGLLLLPLCVGCATGGRQVADAFPPGSVAAPWVLQSEVWAGSFDAAASALGDDAEIWRKYNPTRVWLAVYTHESETERSLKVRCFAFGSADDARRAFARFQPLEAKPFAYGDAGCWTEIGVLFQWGRLVCDIFGDRASWGSQMQSSLLAAHIARRMPPGAPGDPQ